MKLFDLILGTAALFSWMFVVAMLHCAYTTKVPDRSYLFTMFALLGVVVWLIVLKINAALH